MVATYLFHKQTITVHKSSFILVQPLSGVWLYDPMDCSMPGFPVHHQLPRDCSNSCPSSWWSHPTISSSVVPFSSCLQSFPASESFQMSQFFASGDQSIGFSTSASVLPMNIQDWFPLDGLVGSPCSPRDSQESFPTPQFRSFNSLALSFLYSPNIWNIFMNILVLFSEVVN